MKLLRLFDQCLMFSARTLFWIWPKKDFKVSVYSKEFVLHCEEGGSAEDAQAYATRHAVICATCGDVMFPGRKLCLLTLIGQEVAVPGSLIVEDPPRAVICLRPGCGDALFMTGEIAPDRTVSLFDSPFAAAVGTGEEQFIPSIKDHKG
jgi:hypothetical protein